MSKKRAIAKMASLRIKHVDIPFRIFRCLFHQAPGLRLRLVPPRRRIRSACRLTCRLLQIHLMLFSSR